MAEEKKSVSYGMGIEGIWRTFDPEKTYIKPNTIYQYDFEVKKKPWYLFWADFDINKFTTNFKEDIADKLGTKPDNIELIYVYFDSGINETGEVRIQWRWNEEKVEGVAFSANLAIVCVTAIILLIGSYLTIEKLSPKGAKELLMEFKDIIKYLMYAIIGGGSIYALIKIVNLLSKKKKPEIAKKPKPVGVRK